MVGKKFAVIIVIILAIISTTFLYESGLNTCKLQQLDLESKIDKYAKTKDPSFCDSLNTEISQFNAECKSDIEIQDCG